MNKNGCGYDKVQTEMLTQLRTLICQMFGPDARFENDTMDFGCFPKETEPTTKSSNAVPVSSTFKPTTVRLTPAGMSIEKDMLYIKQKMPELHRLLHYQRCDLSGLRILTQEWRQDLYKFQPVPEEPRHRALSDSRSTLNLLRFYRHHLFGVMPFLGYSYPHQHQQHYGPPTTQFNH